MAMINPIDIKIISQLILVSSFLFLLIRDTEISNYYNPIILNQKGLKGPQVLPKSK